MTTFNTFRAIADGSFTELDVIDTDKRSPNCDAYQRQAWIQREHAKAIGQPQQVDQFNRPLDGAALDAELLEILASDPDSEGREVPWSDYKDIAGITDPDAMLDLLIHTDDGETHSDHWERGQYDFKRLAHWNAETETAGSDCIVTTHYQYGESSETIKSTIKGRGFSAMKFHKHAAKQARIRALAWATSECFDKYGRFSIKAATKAMTQPKAVAVDTKAEAIDRKRARTLARMQRKCKPQ